ncbi:hypothetical protein [Microvirga sp. TS319]|uniref:hypothetical protein n=1 Tax=Microvirga sp. TS319 TaxID=3241165 RepID=UPI00351A5414
MFDLTERARLLELINGTLYSRGEALLWEAAERWDTNRNLRVIRANGEQIWPKELAQLLKRPDFPHLPKDGDQPW